MEALQDDVLTARARTKIVATIGPACRGVDKLANLVRAGVDVFRINSAHGTREDREAILAEVRTAEAQIGRPVGVLLDLAGPKIRLGELFQDPTVCENGAEFRFIRGKTTTSPTDFTSNYEPLIDELNVGDPVMLCDGTIAMVVVDKTKDSAVCKVVGGGLLRSRQGINLPGTKLSVPALTEADLANVVWAAGHGIDFVSLSFVRAAEEIRRLKILLRGNGSQAFVIAKIEKREAMDNLTEIVSTADGIMVARGDLGVEIDVAEIAVAQKRIVHECRRLGKPVIVATQMLDSMHHSRRPTRAEATDVANAILDGADACMLSGETAIGEFPLETVQMMNRIMLATEPMLREHSPPAEDVRADDVHPITAAAVTGCTQMARQLKAKLVVVATRGGGTARLRSKQRDFVPTIGCSDKVDVLRRMCLYWGVIPLADFPVHDGPMFRAAIDQWGRKTGFITKGDSIIFVTGTNFYPMAHNLLVVHEAE